MVFLPKGLSTALESKLSDLSEVEAAGKLIHSEEDLEAFLDTAIKEKEWAINKEAYLLKKRVVQGAFQAKRSSSILKILRICEFSDFFFQRFNEEILCNVKSLQKCLKILIKNPEWIKDHNEIGLKLTSFCFKNNLNHGKVLEALRRMALNDCFHKETSEKLLHTIFSGYNQKDDALAAFLIETGAISKEPQDVINWLKKAITKHFSITADVLIKYLPKELPREVAEELLDHAIFYASIVEEALAAKTSEETVLKLASLGFPIKELRKNFFEMEPKPFSKEAKQKEIKQNLTRKAKALSTYYLELDLSSETQLSQSINNLIDWLLYYPKVKELLLNKKGLVKRLLKEIQSPGNEQNKFNLIKVLNQHDLLSKEALHELLHYGFQNKKINIVKEILPNFKDEYEFLFKESYESKDYETALFLAQSGADTQVIEISLIFIKTCLIENQAALALLNLFLKRANCLKFIKPTGLQEIFDYLLRHKEGEKYALKLIENSPFIIRLITDERGNTFLNQAINCGKIALAKRILELEGGLINTPNHEGKTALYLSLMPENRAERLAAYLIDDGADPELVIDGDGKTLQQLAQSNDPLVAGILRMISENLKVKASKSAPSLETLTSLANFANLFADNFFKGMEDDKGDPLEGNLASHSLCYFNTLLSIAEKEILDLPSDSGSFIKKAMASSRYLAFKSKFRKLENFAHEIDEITLSIRKKELTEELAKRIVHQKEKLQAGESLLLPVGWGGSTVSHAMLLEIAKEESGAFELSLWTTGDGIQFHEILMTHSKLYAKQVETYSHIPSQKIDSAFLESLIELLSSSHEYNASDLYLGVFHRFENYRVQTSAPEIKFNTTQRAGSCSIRVLAAYLKQQFPGEVGKTLYYFIKKAALQAILDVVKSNKASKKRDFTFETVVRGATENFARSMLHAFRATQEDFNDHLEEFTLADFIETLKELEIDPRKDKLTLGNIQTLSSRLSAKSKSKKKGKVVIPFLDTLESAKALKLIYEIAEHLPQIKRKSSHLNFIIPEGLASNAWQLNETLKTLSILVNTKGVKEDDISLDELPPFPVSIDSTSLTPFLKSFHARAQFLQNYEKASPETNNQKRILLDLSCKTALEMPLPFEEIKDLSMEETNQIIDDISLLKEKIIDNIKANPIAFPERITALFMLATWIHQLSSKEHEINHGELFPLSQFAFDVSLLHNLKENVHNIAYDPFLKQKIDEILFHHSKNNERAQEEKLFAYETWKSLEQNVILPIPETSAEFQYLKRVASQIEEKNWKKADEYHAKLSYQLKDKLSKEDIRLSFLWAGFIQGTPKTYLILQNLILFARLLNKCSKNKLEITIPTNRILFGIEIESKHQVLKLTFYTHKIDSKANSWNETRNVGTYANTHRELRENYFSFQEKKAPREFVDALSHETSQNEYLISSPRPLEPFLGMTQTNELKFYHLLSWLKKGGEGLLNKEEQVCFSLILFRANKLQEAINADETLGKELLEAIDLNLNEIKLSLSEIKDRRKSVIDQETRRLIETKLFLLHQKIRFIANLKLESHAVGEIRKEFDQLMQWAKSFEDPFLEELVSCYLLASFLYFKPSQKDAFRLIYEGWKLYHLSKSIDDPSIEQEARRAYLNSFDLFASALSKPKDRDRFIEEFLANTYDLNLNSDFKVQGEFPFFKVENEDSHYEIDFISCTIKKGALLFQDLSEIERHPSYQEVFKDQKLKPGSSYVKDGKKVYEAYQAGHLFRFTLSQKNFREDFAELSIERMFEGGFFTYIPSHKAPMYPEIFPLPKHPASQHYVFWISNNDKRLFIIDKKTQEAIEINEQKVVINGEVVHWVDAEKISGAEAIYKLDNKKFIAFFKAVSGDEIRFTRLVDEQGKKIQFKRKNDKFKLNDNSGFFIASSQKIKGLDKGFASFLVLENKKGEKKLLLPLKSYNSQKDSFAGPDIFETILLDLSKTHELKAKNPKETLILAYYHLLYGDEEISLTLLKSLRNHKRFTAEELKYLAWIILSVTETNNNKPNVIALRCFAAWLSFDNLFRNVKAQKTAKTNDLINSLYDPPEAFLDFFENESTWMDETINRITEERYIQYLNIRKNVYGKFRLDSSKSEKRTALLKPYEEICWLQSMIKKSNNPISHIRLHHLISEEKHFQLKIPSNRYTPILTPIISFFGESKNSFGKATLSNNAEILKALRTIYPRTRPGKRLQDHFMNFFNLAQKGNLREREELLAFLNDSLFERDPLNAALRLILTEIANKGEDATKLEGYINSKNLTDKELKNLNALLKKLEKSNRIESKTDIPLLKTDLKLLPLPSKKEKVQFLDFQVSGEDRAYFIKKAELGKELLVCSKNKKEHKSFPSLKAADEYDQVRADKLKKEYETGSSLNDQIGLYELKEEEGIDDVLNKLKEGGDDHQREIELLLEKTYEIWMKSYFENSVEKGLKTKFELMSGKRSLPSFSEMTALFLQRDPEGYLNYNPNLSLENIQTLHNLIGKILLQLTDQNEIEKRIGYFEDLKKQIDKGDSGAQFDLLQKLGSSFEENFGFDPSIYSDLLVFEWALKIRVRRDQIEDLNNLMNKGNVFLQKIMGAGKTLVYGTIVSYKKADGYHLSVLVPTSSLCDTTTGDAKMRSMATFQQRTQTFKFSRCKEYFNVPYLCYFYNSMVTAIIRRDSVILAPETLQSLENQYIEARDTLRCLYQNLENDDVNKATLLTEINELEQPTQVLKQTLKLFRERAIFTYDEPDQTLESKLEHNFPLGEKIRLPNAGVQLVKELYLIAGSSNEIINLGLDIKENKQTEVPIVNLDQIKKILAQKILLEVIQSKEKSAFLHLNSKALRSIAELYFQDERAAYKKVSSGLKLSRLEEAFKILGFSPSKEQLKGYNDKKIRIYKRYVELKKLEAIYNYWLLEIDPPSFVLDLAKQKDEASESIVLIKQELQEWLKNSFERTADLHYGFSQIDENKKIAIPFSANNTPSERSEFADPWEMANRTFQLYLYKGLNSEQTKHFIEKIKAKVKQEWFEAGSLPFETETAKLFSESFSKNILEISTDDLETVEFIKAKFLEAENPLVLSFLLNYVASDVVGKASFYPFQISSNGQNLASMSETINGYTGTMESADTFPERVEVLFDEGTIGRIIDVLLNRNDVVHVIAKAKPSDHLKHLLGWETLTSEKSKRAFAFVDLGPIYKGLSSLDAALDILNYFTNHPIAAMQKIKGVLTWDDKHQLLTCIKKGFESQPIILPSTDKETILALTGLTQEELFVFYPHHKLTGADIQLPDDALVFASFSETTPLRDFMQGVCRPRKLFFNQHVEMVVLESVAPMIVGTARNYMEIKGDISILDLIVFSEQIECARQKRDLIRSVIQKIQNEVRKFALRRLYDEVDPVKENEEYIKARHLFVRAAAQSLFLAYAYPEKEVETVEFLKNLINNLIFPYLVITLDTLEIKDKSICALIENLKQIQNKALLKLPKTLSKRINEPGKESSIEQQEEADSLKEREEEGEYQIELESIGNTNVELKPYKELGWTHENLAALSKDGLSIQECFSISADMPAIYRLRDVFETSPDLNSYAKCFSKELFATENYLRVVDQEINIIDSYQKPIYELLVTKSIKKKWQVTLLSIAEGAFFKENLRHMERPVWLLSSTGGLISANSALEMDSKLQKLLIEVMFLKGDIKELSSQKWINFVDRWLEHRPKLKQKLFETALISENSPNHEFYYGSTLHRIFTSKSSQSKESVRETKRFAEAMLSAKIKRVKTALTLFKIEFNKGPLQKDDFRSVIFILNLVLRNSSETNLKTQAKAFLIRALNQALKLSHEDDLSFIIDVLPMVKEIHDLDILNAIYAILKILVERGEIQAAYHIAKANIATSKDLKIKDTSGWNESLFTLRKLQLKIISLFENKTEDLSIIETFKQTVFHWENKLIRKALKEILNEAPEITYSLLDCLSKYIPKLNGSVIPNQIDVVFKGFSYEAKKYTPLQILELIHREYLQYKVTLPSLYKIGLELLNKIRDGAIEYDSYYGKRLCKKAIFIAKVLFESGISEAQIIAKSLLKDYIKTGYDFDKIEATDKKTLDEILFS